MGGSAFKQAYADGQPTLNTPRMSPEEYKRLKNAFLKKTREHFPENRILPLTEAPEKTDYGDIDLVLAASEPPDFVRLANRLGAAGVICHSPWKCTVGVPKDGTSSSRPAVVYKDLHGAKPTSAPTTTEEYAQIDIEVVSPELLDWFIFYSSYGDMVGLLGHIVHQLGFRVTDRGLFLRMKELDFSKTVNYVNVADRDGFIFLSSDPHQTMRFLGCSVGKYEAGFKTLDELYEWLGSCRLLSPEALKIKRDNAHERNREEKRTVYSRFFNEWLPKHMDMKAGRDEEEQRDRVEQLRAQYLEQALEFFSKKTEYAVKNTALTLTLKNGLAADLLKTLIAEETGKKDRSLNEIVKAFRRYVRFDDQGEPHILERPHSDAESELHKLLDVNEKSLRDPEFCRMWVRKNWERLRSLERDRAKFGLETNT